MLKEKVVVVSGAGSGLGRALSLAFCREQAKVIGLGRQAQTLQDTKNKINDELSDASFTFYEVDVSKSSEIEVVVNKIIEEFGDIDFLYNNAAVYPKVNFLEETPDDFCDACMINIVGVSNLCKAVLPSMINGKKGRIFNVGSWADVAPAVNSAAYSASKGAIHALTKSIAKDIEHLNVDVQVHEWIPGHLNTQMSGYTGIAPEVSASWGVMLAKRENLNKNCIFECDQEWVPPKSLKQRIKDKLLFKKN